MPHSGRIHYIDNSRHILTHIKLLRALDSEQALADMLVKKYAAGILRTDEHYKEAPTDLKDMSRDNELQEVFEVLRERSKQW